MALMILGPPGWVTQAPTSVVLRPCEARKVVTSLPRYCSTTAAKSRDRTSSNPAEPTSYPMVRSESGYRWLRESRMSGPSAPMSWARFTPAATTAAAPSANNALPTRPGSVGLYPGYVSEHSSTETNAATPSGAPRR